MVSGCVAVVNGVIYGQSKIKDYPVGVKLPKFRKIKKFMYSIIVYNGAEIIKQKGDSKAVTISNQRT